MSRRRRYIAAAVVGYATLATAWIYFSEGLLGAVADPETLIRFGTAKGLAFVIVTAGILVVALAKMPAAEVERPRRSTAQRIWPPLGAFLAMASVISVAGVLAYVTEVDSIETMELDRLGGVVKLRATSLAHWIGERRANVDALTGSLAMRRDLAQLLDTRDPGARERIVLRMRVFVDHYGFSALRLYDAAGNLAVAVGDTTSFEDRSDLAAAQAERQTIFLDLRPGPDGGDVMGFAAPLDAVGNTGQLGTMAFELSPGQFLYPFLRNWPTTNRTRETFIARRDGDMLVAVGPPPRGATRIRPAVDGRWWLQSLDPGGGATAADAAVLAARQPVAGTPWILVAKVDRDEMLAGIRHAAFDVGIIVALALAATAGLLAAMWQRRRLRDALGELGLNDYLVRVAQVLPGTLLSFRISPGGSISVPYASKNMKEIVGLDPATLARGASALFARVHSDDLDRVLGDISRSAKSLSLLRTEFRMTVAERGEIWIECRAMPEREAGGDVLFHGFALDVTERKQAEDRLRLASTVFTSSHDGILLTDRDHRIIAANPAFAAITGYSEQEAIGQTPRLLKSGRQDDSFYRAVWNAIASHGYWQGEIWNRRKCGEIYPEWITISEVRNQAGEITNYVATFADISRLKRSEAAVEHLAWHDSLTGLPNRDAFRLALARRLAQTGSVDGIGAIILLDLDRFRIVNDSCGHVTGDKLLKLVAQRLEARTRAADLVACSGGDRFMVLLAAIETRAEAGELAARLRAALAEPFVLEDGQTRYVGASFGISVFPEDGGDADRLIQQAGAALNHAKATGGNAICFYSSIFTDNAVARIELETDLRRALENDEFVLHYQPLVSIADRRVTGVEALIRWRAPGGGLVPPGLFIPVAEETGIIIPLGEWVMRAACRQMMAWRAAGVMLDCIAVNLSPAQFNDPLLTQRVGDVLEMTGLPADCLEIEITEGALLGSGDEVADRLARLKDLGVRLAIDDFGTGYSSLAYLKRFPIDKLKIDRSFVSGLPDDDADAKIIHAVIEMGRSLNLEVLAEGVETEAQLAFLREQGCDTAQGFLFGAATEPETIVVLAREPLGRPAPLRRPRRGRARAT